MSNWTAKDRLIDHYSEAIMEATLKQMARSDTEFDWGFLDTYLTDFAVELENLITYDIKARIDSIL